MEGIYFNVLFIVEVNVWGRSLKLTALRHNKEWNVFMSPTHNLRNPVEIHCCQTGVLHCKFCVVVGIGDVFWWPSGLHVDMCLEPLFRYTPKV